MTYRVTKTYPHSLGLSACFRQWRAESHCNQLHGYALAFTLTFETETLDARNWVLDFGSLKQVRRFLERTFDHRLLVAADDPELSLLSTLHDRGVANVLVLETGVGCEMFATLVAEFVTNWIKHDPVKLVSVECREHEGNSATWIA